MWFFFAQALPLFFYPLGLACMLLAASILGRRWPRLRRAAAVSALLLLLVSGNRWVAYSLVRAVESVHPFHSRVASADVIVVVGGPIDPGRNSEPNGEYSDRLAYALELYRAGVAPRILLSGGGLPWREAETSEAQRMAELLRHRGVPDDAIWIETESRNTRENAVRSKLVLDSHGAHRVVLVTSALHMARAVACFAKVGFVVTAAPCDFLVGGGKWNRLLGSRWPEQVLAFLPAAEHVTLTSAALKECFGLVVYRLRQWI